MMWRRAWTGLLLALPLALPAGAAVAQVAAQARGAHHRVVIEAMRFDPPTLKLQPGDVVEWVNKDPFPHTATAAGRFDTGEIAPESSRSVRITGSGNIDYVCTLHPTMKGRLQLP
jgi:plastocyanin